MVGQLGVTGQVRSRKASKNMEAWINNPAKVMDWVGKYNLEKMLDKGGGIVKISNFFPELVAEGILEVLENLGPEEWNVTEAARDFSSNNIAHKFWSCKTARGMAEIFRALCVLQPGRLNTFSAGKYEQSNHIEAHDDRAYADVILDRNVKVKCSRDIAVIYYLTKDWKGQFGGILVDLPTATRYVPEFNSLIAFRIPRFHEVTAVTAERPRFSIFGWFLTEGKLYELYKGAAADGGYGGDGVGGAGLGFGGGRRASACGLSKASNGSRNDASKGSKGTSKVARAGAGREQLDRDLLAGGRGGRGGDSTRCRVFQVQEGRRSTSKKRSRAPASPQDLEGSAQEGSGEEGGGGGSGASGGKRQRKKKGVGRA